MTLAAGDSLQIEQETRKGQTSMGEKMKGTESVLKWHKAYIFYTEHHAIREYTHKKISAQSVKQMSRGCVQILQSFHKDPFRNYLNSIYHDVLQENF